jgi:hypothetical protein
VKVTGEGFGASFTTTVVVFSTMTSWEEEVVAGLDWA